MHLGRFIRVWQHQFGRASAMTIGPDMIVGSNVVAMRRPDDWQETCLAL